VKGAKAPASSEVKLPAGTYYWQAVYSGDKSNPAATSVCKEDVEKVKGEPWVVSLGDSAISGNGGRWAGNTARNEDWKKIDALGLLAYRSPQNRELGGEAIPGCMRSWSAEIFIQNGVKSKNLACSGAVIESESSATFFWGNLISQGHFYSGLDDVDAAYGAYLNPLNKKKGRCGLTAGCKGQVKQLEEFAKERKANGEQIKMVVVQVGANMFGFRAVGEACGTAFALGNECNADSSVTSRFLPAAVGARRGAFDISLRFETVPINIASRLASTSFFGPGLPT